MRRQSEYNIRFVDVFRAAHESAVTLAKSVGEQPSESTPATYSRVAEGKSKKRKTRIVVATAGLFVGGTLAINAGIRQSQINDAIRDASSEAALISEEFCQFVDTQIAATESRSQSAYDVISEKRDQAEEEIRVIVVDNYYIPSDRLSYRDLLGPIIRCSNEAYERIAPTTTAAPRERSDAEIVAEGRTCA